MPPRAACFLYVYHWLFAAATVLQRRTVRTALHSEHMPHAASSSPARRLRRSERRPSAKAWHSNTKTRHSSANNMLCGPCLRHAYRCALLIRSDVCCCAVEAAAAAAAASKPSARKSAIAGGTARRSTAAAAKPAHLTIQADEPGPAAPSAATAVAGKAPAGGAAMPPAGSSPAAQAAAAADSALPARQLSNAMRVLFERVAVLLLTVRSLLASSRMQCAPCSNGWRHCCWHDDSSVTLCSAV